MSKYENTREVIFKEDYNPSGIPSRVIYKKNVKHYIHKDIVDKLQKLGVKLTVNTVDFKKIEEKIKGEKAKAKKAALSV